MRLRQITVLWPLLQGRDLEVNASFFFFPLQCEAEAGCSDIREGMMEAHGAMVPRGVLINGSLIKARGYKSLLI